MRAIGWRLGPDSLQVRERAVPGSIDSEEGSGSSDEVRGA